MRGILKGENWKALEQANELLSSGIAYREFQHEFVKVVNEVKLSFPVKEIFAQEKFGITKEDLEYSI